MNKKNSTSSTSSQFPHQTSTTNTTNINKNNYYHEKNTVDSNTRPNNGFYSNLLPTNKTYNDLSGLLSNKESRHESTSKLSRQNTMPNMGSVLFENHSRWLSSYTSPAALGNPTTPSLNNATNNMNNNTHHLSNSNSHHDKNNNVSTTNNNRSTNNNVNNTTNTTKTTTPLKRSYSTMSEFPNKTAQIGQPSTQKSKSPPLTHQPRITKYLHPQAQLQPQQIPHQEYQEQQMQPRQQIRQRQIQSQQEQPQQTRLEHISQQIQQLQNQQRDIQQNQPTLQQAQLNQHGQLNQQQQHNRPHIRQQISHTPHQNIQQNIPQHTQSQSQYQKQIQQPQHQQNTQSQLQIEQRLTEQTRPTQQQQSQQTHQTQQTQQTRQARQQQTHQAPQNQQNQHTQQIPNAQQRYQAPQSSQLPPQSINQHPQYDQGQRYHSQQQYRHPKFPLQKELTQPPQALHPPNMTQNPIHQQIPSQPCPPPTTQQLQPYINQHYTHPHTHQPNRNQQSQPQPQPQQQYYQQPPSHTVTATQASAEHAYTYFPQIETISEDFDAVLDSCSPYNSHFPPAQLDYPEPYTSTHPHTYANTTHQEDSIIDTTQYFEPSYSPPLLLCDTPHINAINDSHQFSNHDPQIPISGSSNAPVSPHDQPHFSSNTSYNPSYHQAPTQNFPSSYSLSAPISTPAQPIFTPRVTPGSSNTAFAPPPPRNSVSTHVQPISRDPPRYSSNSALPSAPPTQHFATPTPPLYRVSPGPSSLPAQNLPPHQFVLPLPPTRTQHNSSILPPSALPPPPPAPALQFEASQSRAGTLESARSIRNLLQDLKSSRSTDESTQRAPGINDANWVLIPVTSEGSTFDYGQQYDDGSTFDYGDLLDEDLAPIWEEEERLREEQYQDQFLEQEEEIFKDVLETGEIADFHEKYDDALETAGGLAYQADWRIHEAIFQASQEKQPNTEVYGYYYPVPASQATPEPRLTPSDDPSLELDLNKFPDSPEEIMNSPQAQILQTPSRMCPNYIKSHLHNLNFYSRFELDRAISLDYLKWDHVTPDFIQELKVLENHKDAQKLVLDLAKLHQPTNLNLKYGVGLEDDVEDGKAFASRKVKEVVYVVRAEISLETIQFFLTPHNPNKLIRKFGADRVMRVKFTETMPDYLQDRAKAQARIVFQRGIELAGRHYQYVSPFSSMGKGGCGGYFLATSGDGITETCTQREVQSWMGDFRSVTPFSKRMARLSQSLGKVIPTIRLQKEQMEMIDDIEELIANGAKMNFTDGCGFIAYDLALKVWEILKEKCAYTPDRYMPMVFQIRIGGIKGLLLVTKAIFNKIQYRASMYKHDTHEDDLHYTLDVLNFSCPGREANLNRDFIQILFDNGVPFEVFEMLLQQRYSELDSTMSDSDALQRIFQLKKRSKSPTGSRDDYFNFTNRVILDMLIATVELDEPVLQDKTNEWRKNKTQKIQSKFHINVPKSKYMYGACDPTGRTEIGPDGKKIRVGAIPPGCVFVQFSGSTSPHCGPIVVGRTPGAFPWDMQKFQAVYVPELVDYWDVVLFSVQSERPDFDILGGGDLDGDYYWLCWERAIVEHFTPSPPPPLEPKPKPLEDCDATVDLCDEMTRQINYLVGKMFYYELQKISEWHQRISDIYSTKSELAIELAKAHAMATDEDKTGRVPCVPSHVRFILNNVLTKPKLKPHFKSKNSYFGTYRSTGILGQLYDTLSNRLVEVDINSHKISIKNEFLAPGYEHYLPAAEEFIERVTTELHDAYNRSEKKAEKMARIKLSVFANSNHVFAAIVDQANIEHPHLLSSAVYFVAYKHTIEKKELVGAKLAKVHEYPWLCDRVRRDLVTLKAQQDEKPGVRPSAIANSVFLSLFSSKV